MLHWQGINGGGFIYNFIRGVCNACVMCGDIPGVMSYINCIYGYLNFFFFLGTFPANLFNCNLINIILYLKRTDSVSSS